MTRIDLDFLGVLPVVGFVVAVTLLPAALLFATGIASAGGAAAVARTLVDPVNLRAVENSLSEGSASALAAVAVGYPCGVFLGRTRVPGRSLILSALLVAFLLPTIAVAVGVVELFGPGGFATSVVPGLLVLGHGFGGIVASNVLFNAPLVVLLTIVGVESASSDLEETVASLGGGAWERFRAVWGRPSLLGALAGGLVTFLFSALAFAGPILIGGAPWYTLEARVYVLAQTLAEGPQAAVLAMLGVAILAPATALYVILSGRLRQPGVRTRHRPKGFDRRRPGSWVLAAWTAVVVGGTGLLLGAIVYRGLSAAPASVGGGSLLGTLFSPAVSARIGVSTVQALANTLLFATLASATALLLALSAARFLARRPGVRPPLAAIAFAPLLLSPVVLSFSLAEFVRPVLGGESAVPLLIVLSQAALALPFALQAIGLSLSSVPTEIGEAARALGATPRQAYLDVELPEIRAGIRTSALFAFALGLGEFTATNFLATSSSTTLSVEVYRLESVRLGAVSEAATALLVLTSLAVFAVAARWGAERADVL